MKPSKYVIKKGVSNLVGAEGEIIGNIPKNLKNTLLSLVNSEAGLNFILRNPNSKISRNYEEDNKLITELEKMRLENSKIKDNNRRYEEAIAKTVASLLTETQKICSEIGYNKPIFVNIPNSNINNREKVKEENELKYVFFSADLKIDQTRKRDKKFQRALARGDKSLLNEYANYIFAQGKKRFGYDNAMGVFLSSTNGNSPEMRAWCVDWLVGRSDADGGVHLGSGDGRFLGIAPEALSAPGKGASNIKSYTMADLQAFDGAVKGLEATVRPELLAPFAQLRKKL